MGLLSGHSRRMLPVRKLGQEAFVGDGSRWILVGSRCRRFGFWKLGLPHKNLEVLLRTNCHWIFSCRVLDDLVGS